MGRVEVEEGTDQMAAAGVTEGGGGISTVGSWCIGVLHEQRDAGFGENINTGRRAGGGWRMVLTEQKLRIKRR